MRLFLVIAGLLLLLLPHPILRVPSAGFFLCLVPALALTSRAGYSLIGTLALTTAISPILFGAVVLILMTLGAGTPAVWIALILFSLIYIIFGSDLPAPARDEKRMALALVIIFALVAAAVFYLPLFRLWWRVRDDSWFHAAVLNRLSTHGLPLEDPYFSPIRLQYMYFYHILLKCGSVLARTGPFYTMILLNFIALANMAIGFVFLSSFFSRNATSRLLGLWMALLSMNGLFFIFFPLRIARALWGKTQGVDFLRHSFTLSPPGHATASAFLSVSGNQVFLLDKFMLGTALSLTLGLTCVFAALFITIRPKDRLRALLLGLSQIGLLLLHLVIGFTALLALACAAITYPVLARVAPGLRTAGLPDPTDRGEESLQHEKNAASRLGRTFDRFPSSLVLLISCLALVVTFPYVFSVIPHHGGENSVHLAIQAKRILGLLADVLPVLLLALPVILFSKKRAGSSRIPMPFLLWTFFIALASLSIDLPTNNETKFAFILFIPLAAMAVQEIASLLPRRRLLLFSFIFISTIPLNAVYFTSAFHDKTKITITADESALYRWISQHTDKDALFLEDDDIARIPVLASRDLYWGNAAYAHIWGYPEQDMRKRRALRDLVFSQESLKPSDFNDVAKMGRPFYVVCRTHSLGGKAALQKLSAGVLFKLVFSQGDIHVFQLLNSH